MASYAASKLPKSVKDLCRDVYAHFHRSSYRQDVYKKFQAFFDTEPLKLLSPAQTRWLSLQECMNHILEQFIALKNYFIVTANEDLLHTNDRILAPLQNPFFQAYLGFLSFQLERFNAFNRLFQSERPLLHNLKIEVEGLLKAITSNDLPLGTSKHQQVKQNLIHFITILSSLPFANAAVERAFSQLKLVKTDHRNSLKSSSFVSLLQSKMSLKNRHVTAASLKPSKELLKLLCNRMQLRSN